LNLSAKNKSEIERIFYGKTTKKPDEIAESIAQFAFDEWMEWLSNSERPVSLTEQSINRVIKIFSNVMPDAEPDVDFLYNKFNIPFGKARYIIQVVSERQLRELNDRSWKQLITALTKAEAEGTGRSEAKIQVSRRAGRILGFVIKTASRSHWFKIRF